MPKFVIYQVIPRLFGNYNTTRKYKGTIQENGCGKFSSFTPKAFEEIKALGATHIWYTALLSMPLRPITPHMVSSRIIPVW